MSDARDNMMALVARVSAGLEGDWSSKVRQHMDAYAHELAERQRDAAHIVRLVGLEAEDAVRVSANLIDPEVSQEWRPRCGRGAATGKPCPLHDPEVSDG